MLEYDPQKHHYGYERTIQSGGWGKEQQNLTYRHVFPSFQNMIDTSCFEFNIKIFLLLAETYIEDDFVKSMHPQITFKGIGLVGHEESKQDINLVDVSEIAADFAVVGGVIRLARKLYGSKISNTISNIKRNVVGVDGSPIGNISDTLYDPSITKEKLGIHTDLKIHKKASGIIRTSVQISLSHSQILDILKHSRDMPEHDLKQYGEPRMVLRVNYPEGLGGLENIGPHPRGHFLMQQGKSEHGIKVNTNRTSYSRLNT